MQLPTDPLPSDLIKPSQAATLLGLHKNTIYRWINTGQLPVFRLGCHLRVSEAAVRACCRPVPRPQVQRPATRRQARRLDEWADEVLRSQGII